MKLQFNLRLPAEVTLTKWTTPNLLEDKPSSGHLMMLGFKYFEPSLYQFPICGSPKTPNQMFTPEILPSKGVSFSTVPSAFWFCPMIIWAHWATLYTTLSLDTLNQTLHLRLLPYMVSSEIGREHRGRPFDSSAKRIGWKRWSFRKENNVMVNCDALKSENN